MRCGKERGIVSCWTTPSHTYEHTSVFTTNYKLLTKAFAIITIVLVNLPDGKRHSPLQLRICRGAVIVVVVLVTSLEGTHGLVSFHNFMILIICMR